MLPAEAAGDAAGDAIFGTTLAVACRNAAGTATGAAATLKGETGAGAGTGTAAGAGAGAGVGMASRVVTRLVSSAAGTLSVLQDTCYRLGLHAMCVSAMGCHIPVFSRRVPGHCKEMSIKYAPDLMGRGGGGVGGGGLGGGGEGVVLIAALCASSDRAQ